MAESKAQADITPVISTSSSRIRLRERLIELYRFRYLLFNLVVRDLKIRYKGSLLGVVWSFLNPLLMMLVFTLIFEVAFGRSDVRQYPIFFLVGLLPWNFFSGSIIGGPIAITNNASILKKVYFPRELLPIATVLSNLVNFGFAFLILIAFLLFSGLGISEHALWVIPLLITQILFTAGLVLTLSAVNVFYRDVLMIMDVLMLAWFFLTPIMYSLDFFGASQTIVGISFNPGQVMRWLNPMASIIDGFRTVLWGTLETGGPAPMFPPYLYRTLATSLIVFVFGYWVFLKLEGTFGEKL